MTFRGFLVSLGIAGICACVAVVFFIAYMHDEYHRFPGRSASSPEVLA